MGCVTEDRRELARTHGIPLADRAMAAIFAKLAAGPLEPRDTYARFPRLRDELRLPDPNKQFRAMMAVADAVGYAADQALPRDAGVVTDPTYGRIVERRVENPSPDFRKGSFLWNIQFGLRATNVFAGLAYRDNEIVRQRFPTYTGAALGIMPNRTFIRNIVETAGSTGWEIWHDRLSEAISFTPGGAEDKAWRKRYGFDEDGPLVIAKPSEGTDALTFEFAPCVIEFLGAGMHLRNDDPEIAKHGVAWTTSGCFVQKAAGKRAREERKLGHIPKSGMEMGTILLTSGLCQLMHDPAFEIRPETPTHSVTAGQILFV